MILLAPSRCGKTPTSMYLASSTAFVANYHSSTRTSSGLRCRPGEGHRERASGSPTRRRLSGAQREATDSTYASVVQCRWELRRAGEMYAQHRIPVIDSSSRSVEEMSTLIIQTLSRKGRS